MWPGGDSPSPPLPFTSSSYTMIDWNVAGAIGEMAGALAVVISLLYVGRQVRLANAQARSEAYRAISQSASELLTAWAGDDAFLPTVRSGVVERTLRLAELSADDQARAILRFAAGIRIFETIHRQVEAGTLDADAYEMFGGMMFRNPLFHDIWDRLKGAYAPDFAEVMERQFGLHGHLDDPA